VRLDRVPATAFLTLKAIGQLEETWSSGSRRHGSFGKLSISQVIDAFHLCCLCRLPKLPLGEWILQQAEESLPHRVGSRSIDMSDLVMLREPVVIEDEEGLTLIWRNQSLNLSLGLTYAGGPFFPCSASRPIRLRLTFPM